MAQLVVSGNDGRRSPITPQIARLAQGFLPFPD